MTTTVLDVLASHRAGYWGVEAGGAEVDVRAIRNGDVGTTGTLRLDELPSRGFTAAERDRAQVRLGDLVITSSGNCGEVAIIDREPAEPTCVTNFVRRLRPNRDVVDSRYIFHFMRRDSFRTALAPFVRGTTLKNLSVESALGHVPIPLPSLEEQRRVAAILDQADALRAKRRSVMARVDALTDSVFSGIFGEMAAWPVVALRDMVAVGDRINYGVVQPGNDVEDGVPLIRVADLRCGRVDRTRLKLIDPAIVRKYARSRIRGNEILITCVGSTGVIALAGEQDIGSNVARAVTRVPIEDPITRLYVAHHLRSARVQRYFTNELRTVSQPTLNGKQISETQVPVPPFDLQVAFAKAVHCIEDVAVVREHELELFDDLFASLRDRAFKGEL